MNQHNSPFSNQLNLQDKTTSIKVSKSRLAESLTGCFPSPNRSTTAGTIALKCNLNNSPDNTAADDSDKSAPCETLKLLSFNRSRHVSTNEVTSEDDKLFLEASRTWWRRSTPAIRSFVSFERDISKASSIVIRE